MKNKRKKFEKFLRGKNAWNEFVRLFATRLHPSKCLETYLKRKNYRCFVLGGFDWPCDNVRYWSILDDKWKNICSRPSKLDNLTRGK